jgi:hypothetical protein
LIPDDSKKAGKMAGDHPESKTGQGSGTVSKSINQAEKESKSYPTVLSRVGAASLSAMIPGDILFLDEEVSLETTEEGIFCAIISCPVCGASGLITPAQFLFGIPVMCGAKYCPALFRIVDRSRLIYQPKI